MCHFVIMSNYYRTAAGGAGKNQNRGKCKALAGLVFDRVLTSTEGGEGLGDYVYSKRADLY